MKPGTRSPMHAGAADLPPEAVRDGDAMVADALAAHGLVGALPVVVYRARIDEHSSTTYVSPQIRELLGVPAEAVTGACDLWWRALHPDDRGPVQRLLRHCQLTGEPFEAEYRLLKPGGEEVWCHDLARAMPGPDGRPAELVGVVFDITQRRRDEQKLRKRTEQLRRSNRELEQSRRAAVSILQDVTRQRQRAEEASARLAQSEAALKRRAGWAVGLQRAGEKLAACRTVEETARFAARAPVEYLGLPAAWVSRCCPGKAAEPMAFSDAGIRPRAAVACAAHVCRTGKPLIIPNVHDNPDPALCTCPSIAPDHAPAWCAVFPVTVGTQCVAALNLCGEDTESDAIATQATPLLEVFCRQVGEVWQRCLAERQLGIARDAAEDASRAKSRFLANMSHEIRTPLNAILGFTQLLQRDSTLSKEQYGHLDTISRSGAHLLDLINDVLEMSKIEAGNIALKPEPFDLHRLLEDLTMMFTMRSESRRLSFRVERDDGVPPLVVGDQGKLRQVLINLLGNALKFTPDGGVTLRVRRGGAPDDQVKLCFEVEDTGEGIAPEDLRRIFAPFEQTDRGRRVGGTGLGLTISRQYVQMMGGTIAARSTPGQGSCFQFDITVGSSSGTASPRKQPAHHIERLAPEYGEVRVLVADDEEISSRLVMYLLEAVGFTVRVATNGKAALELFESWEPQVVLMDMRMPVVDGYAATREIRRRDHRAGRKTAIIALTGCVFTDQRHAAFEAGVDDFVAKPFREDDLLARIGAAADLTFDFADMPPEPAPPAPAPPVSGARNLAECLPPHLLDALRKATVDADLEWLEQLTAQVREHDPELARTIRSMADRFDYLGLDHLLALSDTPPGPETPLREQDRAAVT